MIKNLAKLLAAKQAEAALSIDALAKAIGVSTVSVRGVLSGKSKPNAATSSKYAGFLGLPVEETAKPAKKGRKTKGKQAKTPKSAKAAKGTRRATGLGAELVSAVSAAAAVLDDQLALAVHTAGAAERDLIARLLRI
jgi:DNA-binding XRE family transcriptional regulator